MITISEPGDTAASVAHRVLGIEDASYAKAISEENQNSFANRMSFKNAIYSPTGVFAPYRALWLPTGSALDNNHALRDQLLHRFDFISGEGRQKLLMMQKTGIDINHAVGSGMLMHYHNKKQQEEGGSSGIVVAGRGSIKCN